MIPDINLSEAETGKFQDTCVDTMAADDLAMQGPMIWTIQSKQVLVFFEEGFQTPEPSQGWKIIENANIFLCFLKSMQLDRVELIVA